MVGQLAPRLYKILECQAKMLRDKAKMLRDRRQYQVSKVIDDIMQFILEKDVDRDWLPTIHSDVKVSDDITYNCNKLDRKELKKASDRLSEMFEFDVDILRLHDDVTVLRLGKPT